MSVISVVPGSLVGLQMLNLPPYTTFTVTMGPAGSRGLGAPVVAHFSTQWGVNVTHWFEIQSEVSKAPSFDVRVDDGAGTAVFLTVDNTTRLSIPADHRDACTDSDAHTFRVEYYHAHGWPDQNLARPARWGRGGCDPQYAGQYRVYRHHRPGRDEGHRRLSGGHADHFH